MNYESSHLEMFVQIGVPKEHAKILRNTFERKHALVKLQTLCL